MKRNWKLEHAARVREGLAAARGVLRGSKWTGTKVPSEMDVDASTDSAAPEGVETDGGGA